NLPLVWQADDDSSALLGNAYLTYQKVGSLAQTGAVFAADNTVLVPGQRRFDFAPDLSAVPNGVEDTYTLQFHADDIVGNRGVSSNFTFLVDTKPPTLDSLFVYPATNGAYNAIVNQSNRLLTVKLECPEPVVATFSLASATSGTNQWFAT